MHFSLYAMCAPSFSSPSPLPSKETAATEVDRSASSSGRHRRRRLGPPLIPISSSDDDDSDAESGWLKNVVANVGDKAQDQDENTTRFAGSSCNLRNIF